MTSVNGQSNIEKKLELFEDDKGTILIVDDEPSTIDLLEAILAPCGYKLLTAQSGKEALEIVDKEDIDLILLDLMMPEMNGYDVCSIIKSRKDIRRIPILVVTALSGLDDNIKALEVGAEGFLTKPFNNQLVAAYVRSLIKIKKLSDEVIKLDQLKDDLTKMIIHDLRNPLISALGFINLSLKENDLKKKEWYAHVIKSGVTEAFSLMENLHDITRLESNKLELCCSGNENIYLIISEIIDSMTPIFEKRDISVNLTSACDLKHAIDPQLFRRVVQNLLSNAAKFATKSTSIAVNAVEENDVLKVEISNKGEIIPEQYWKKIFKKFGQVELKQMGENVGIGLGLAFCKLAVEAHGGRIWVESPAIGSDDGTSFIFEID